MDIFPFIPVIGKMCIYAFPIFFAFIIVCKLFDKQTAKFLKGLKKLTNKRFYQIILFALGCIIGILLGLNYGYTDSILHIFLACLSGLLAGFIITGIAYTIMYRLPDYLKEDK